MSGKTRAWLEQRQAGDVPDYTVVKGRHGTRPTMHSAGTRVNLLASTVGNFKSPKGVAAACCCWWRSPGPFAWFPCLQQQERRLQLVCSRREIKLRLAAVGEH